MTINEIRAQYIFFKYKHWYPYVWNVLVFRLWEMTEMIIW